MFAKTVLSALTLGIMGMATPVSAEGLCEERTLLIGKLQEMYNENHVAGGLESGSKMVEIWTGQSGSWTILETRASGISCVVASGDNWFNLAKTAANFDTES